MLAGGAKPMPKLRPPGRRGVRAGLRMSRFGVHGHGVILYAIADFGKVTIFALQVTVTSKSDCHL
jgi:hypothetical protein